MTWPASEFRLRQCPGDVKGVLAVFFVLAGAGYVSGLVNGHYQSAEPGELLPGPSQLRKVFAGSAERPASKVERVLEAVDGPFNGTGSMRPAFTTRSEGWDSLIRILPPPERERIVSEREGERLAILAWVRAGADRTAYDRDEFDAGAGMAGQPIALDLKAGPGRIRIRTLIERRCVGCHSDGGREDRARLKPFDTYDRLLPVVSTPADPRIPLPKLAQVTAERVPVFALLYAATGLLFCFTAVPRPVRRIVAPLPLVSQGIVSASVWLARWDATFVWAVVAGEVFVGVGFAIHVFGGLWELTRSGCGPPPSRLKCNSPYPTGR